MFTTRPMHIATHMAESLQTKPAPMIPIVYENVPAEPARWEYLVFKVDTRHEPLLDSIQMNELGNKGWFLTGMLRQVEESLVHYYFVRQLVQ